MQAVLDLFNVLHEPTAVFGRVKEKPRIWEPFIPVAIILTLLAVLSLPFQDAVMQIIRSSLPPEQQARVASPTVIKTVIQTPIFVLIGLLVGGFLLWLGAMMTGAQAKYKMMTSVLAYSYVTYVLYAIVAYVVISIRGASSIQSFADLRAPLGLDLLAPNSGLFLGGVLNGINPFSIWGVYICGTGISVTSGASKGAAFVVTSVIFLIGLLLQTAPLLLVGMMTKQ